MTSEKAPELLPCPFCGGEAEFEWIGTTRYSVIVTCADCGCSLENGETFKHGTAWNTRPQPESVSNEGQDVSERLIKAAQEAVNTAAGDTTCAIWHYIDLKTVAGYGPWVRKADYDAKIAAKDARIAELEKLLEDAAQAVEWGARRLESKSQTVLMEKWASEYRAALSKERDHPKPEGDR